MQCFFVHKKKLRARGVRGRPCAYCYLGCLLVLCGSTLHPALLRGGFRVIFFLLGVWSPCYKAKNYTLSRKKKQINNSRGVREHLET